MIDMGTFRERLAREGILVASQEQLKKIFAIAVLCADTPYAKGMGVLGGGMGATGGTVMLPGLGAAPGWFVGTMAGWAAGTMFCTVPAVLIKSELDSLLKAMK